MLAFDLTRKQLVFLKDYWRANVDGIDKEGEIYRLLHAKKVPHIAPFGMGNDVRNQETHTQTLTDQKPPLSWLLPTARQICLRHYRMSLDVVGRNLTEFQSSRQFISAIADAMEAHDVAFFDCGLLHRDISVGNIILMDVNQGLLIDWDLCANLDDDNNKHVARRPTRMGTWQFMSVNLLKGSSGRHSHQNDRESAFYVMLWTALRYTKTQAAPCSVYTPQNILRAFGEIYVDPIGRRLGGDKKEILLRKYGKQGILFTERPELDSLMAELATIFDVLYGKKPTVAQFKSAKAALTRIEAADAEGDMDPDIELLRQLLVDHPAYDYRQAKNKLKKRGWLTGTIRKYLDMGDWPKDEWCSGQPSLSSSRSSAISSRSSPPQ